MVADPGYCDKKFTNIVKEYWDNLVCPLLLKDMKVLQKRLEFVYIYRSTLGQVIYRQRGRYL